MARLLGRTKLTFAILAASLVLAIGCEPAADVPDITEADKAASGEAASMWTEEQKQAYTSAKQSELAANPPQNADRGLAEDTTAAAGGGK